MDISVNLHQVIHSLCGALDLVGVDEVGHGKRVAYMAAECATLLNYDIARFDRLVAASILHDCGVSSTRLHQNLVRELDWSGAQEHCNHGYHLLLQCAPLTDIAVPVRYHHTHWKKLDGLEQLPGEDREMANLIFLVDRVDALRSRFSSRDLPAARNNIYRALRKQSGQMFDPRLVDAFMQASQHQSFWLLMEDHYLEHYLDAWIERGPSCAVDFPDLRSVAEIFSTIVDAKSPFTATHSRGVGRLAMWLGQWCGLPAATCNKLELAGLFHDLGKLRVPDEILDKPGKLDETEFTLMARHSFDTYMILKPIEGLHDVALWAAMHHEKINGEGYPFRYTAEHIPLEARILAVADVFQALAQNRPYRESLPMNKVIGILLSMVDDGHIDGDVVAEIAARPEESWHYALPEEQD